MEDAMIINKSSLDRGFAHGTLIKCESVDLSEKRGGGKVRCASRAASAVYTYPVARQVKFGRGTASARDKGQDDSAVGPDGLPRIGARLEKDCAFYSVVDETTGIERVTKHKNEDPAYVDQVTVLGTASDKCAPCPMCFSCRTVDAAAHTLPAGRSKRSR
jgi:DNA-directed RNA polymerase I subunit RPA2